MAGFPTDLPTDNNSFQAETATVFQCDCCGTILGDSSTLIFISEPLATVTIRAVEPLRFRIKDRHEKSDSTNALIMGSTFQRVYCLKCSQEVGKVFRNLPSQFSQMSGHITLDVQRITSYEVPKKQDGEVISKLHQEILKIQVVLININQRLTSLENSLALGEEDSSQ